MLLPSIELKNLGRLKKRGVGRNFSELKFGFHKTLNSYGMNILIKCLLYIAMYIWNSRKSQNSKIRLLKYKMRRIAKLGIRN